MPKRSSTPSSTIAFAPPLPSSAGWNKKQTVPATSSRRPVTMRAAPSSIATCPSWPQACMCSARARAVRNVVLLVDRQPVHVGAQHDRLAGPRAVQHADDAGLPDPGVHLEPQRAQPLGDDAGGAVLFEAQLGVLVQIAPGCDDLGRDLGRDVDRQRRRHAR